MVGLWCYNQSGVTELMIMRDPHYCGMCFKSRGSPFLAVKKASAFGLGPFTHLWFYPVHSDGGQYLVCFGAGGWCWHRDTPKTSRGHGSMQSLWVAPGKHWVPNTDQELVQCRANVTRCSYSNNCYLTKKMPSVLHDIINYAPNQLPLASHGTSKFAGFCKMDDDWLIAGALLQILPQPYASGCWKSYL